MKFFIGMGLIGVNWFAIAFVVFVASGNLDLRAQTNASTQTGAMAGRAISDSRLKWRLETTVEAYRKAGHTNSAWNEAAIRALNEMAHSPEGQSESNEIPNVVITNSCRIAMEAGCDDPLIRYLALLYSVDKSLSKEERVTAFCKMAQDMEAASYPAIRKFYAWHWTGHQINATYGHGEKIPKDLLELHPWDKAQFTLAVALTSEKLPPEDAYRACCLILTAWARDKAHFPTVYQLLEQNFPKGPDYESRKLLLKGNSYADMAWQARGSGWANTVSNEGWRLFGERLGIADEALTRAWELDRTDPRIALAMMRVELGQSEGRPRMELWFRRAMALDSNCYDACSSKLNYLDPKWAGSIEEMLKFGHQCVTNRNWGGRVPLILVEAHRTIRYEYATDAMKSDYWKVPEVWLDVKAAYDRYFEINPSDTKAYNNYAWYAYQAGRWRELNAMIPKIEPVNYKTFGGREKFDTMVAEARQHSGAGKASE